MLKTLYHGSENIIESPFLVPASVITTMALAFIALIVFKPNRTVADWLCADVQE